MLESLPSKLETPNPSLLTHLEARTLLPLTLTLQTKDGGLATQEAYRERDPQ